MVAYDQRFVQRAINRLNNPGDGDIVLPQRRMVVVGTTSFEIDDLDYVPVLEDHVKLMLERGAELIPGIRNAKVRGKYMATRPLIGGGIGTQFRAHLQMLRPQRNGQCGWPGYDHRWKSHHLARHG